MHAKTMTTERSTHPLLELGRAGQSVWLDSIRKSLMQSGELARMVERDGLGGVTSNPSIFEKAIAGSDEYAPELASAGRRCATEPKAVYESIAVADIQRAADALSPVYQRSARKDGYVSLEVSPHLAHDTQGTLDEARRLWKAVARENLMIKVPGTPAGIPALRQLVSEGINVNVTLLFSVEVYRQVAMAHLAGLEALRSRGGDPAQVGRVASVASFFVSRIDTAVDKLLLEKGRGRGSEAETKLAQFLLGKTAIANAKLAYQTWLEIRASERWRSLEASGALPQRLLWASTGTKDARYRDTLYVEELIGEDTVNTIPPATYEAFRDHGRVRPSLVEDVAQAREVLALLWQLGVSLEGVTQKLLDEGLVLFEQAFDALLAAVAKKGRAPGQDARTRMSSQLPEALASEVEHTLASFEAEDRVARLWRKDATLWTGRDEGEWLGWLDIVAAQRKDVARFTSFAEEVRKSGWTHVLLLGMGGSSLCPEVLAKTFGHRPGFPEFHVLDSTDPAQVASVERACDLAKTLCIVASKSGSTLEPNIFTQHFFARMQATVGAAQAGAHFVAITDPGSKMQRVAEQDGFRKIFFGVPQIGGRYSALSDFGLVPAALMGIDVAKLLERAAAMVEACGAKTKAAANPGVQLGVIMGCAALAGRDKLTIATSAGLKRLGAWLEQLVAESTGKQGRAVIPVDVEALGPPSVYGDDRIFVYLKLDGDADGEQEKQLAALARSGHPVVRIALSDAHDLAAEFFRWEIATAIAGSVLGIHPFDQPDVEASKIETRKLSEAYERLGSLPSESPFFENEGVKLYTDAANAAALAARTTERTLAGWIRAHLDRVATGDYVALLAYVEMSAAHEASLQRIRHRIRDEKRVATCLGFGPRFLHSTGQAYKGGPASGVVLQVTCDDAQDLPVPGNAYSFGVVKAAQARGDFTILVERKRRALRVHLGKDVAAGLATLERAVGAALATRARGAAPAVAQKTALAMIGLGRMGANMARRLMRGGHSVVAFDRAKDAVAALEREGATGAYTLREAVAKLPSPRVLWVMVPSGAPTEAVVQELSELCGPGDVIVDGGNSYYKDDVRRSRELAKKGIRYVDVGTSGGVWGLERGYCLMIGGEREAFALLEPALATLAPGRGDVAPSAGREGSSSTADKGYLHCGPVGAGHFVKMIHNGIEYGLMQAYAEGFDILRSANKPELPEGHRYDLQLHDIAELWRRGSVVGSWLLDLTAIALAEEPDLASYTGFVQDSGEGRWTVQAAIEESVPADVLTASLFVRFRSRQEHTFAEKILSAMRKQFGGHVEAPPKP